MLSFSPTAEFVALFNAYGIRICGNPSIVPSFLRSFRGNTLCSKCALSERKLASEFFSVVCLCRLALCYVSVHRSGDRFGWCIDRIRENKPKNANNKYRSRDKGTRTASTDTHCRHRSCARNERTVISIELGLASTLGSWLAKSIDVRR